MFQILVNVVVSANTPLGPHQLGIWLVQIVQ